MQTTPAARRAGDRLLDLISAQLLRQHLVADRGWPRQAVRTKPFWTPGKRGLD